MEGAKNRTRFVKLRYRGLKKNATQQFAACALVNVCLARKNSCFWHRLSPGAKVADRGRAAEAGGRSEKPNTNACTRLAEHLLSSKTRAYSEFPYAE